MDSNGGTAGRSLAALARGPDRLLGPALLATTVLLVLGWTLPIMTVERLLFLTERVTILEGCRQLWDAGHTFLFAVIAVFSIVFPLLKLLAALYLWYRADAGDPALGRALGRVEWLGRWSMLDVFVVALVIVGIQMSFVSDVEVHAGLYVFTAAVMLSMVAVQRIAVLAHRNGAGRESDLGARSSG